MTDHIKVIEEAVKEIKRNHFTALTNGGGAWKRQFEDVNKLCIKMDKALAELRLQQDIINVDNAITALFCLVKLKEHKEENGADAYYKKTRPIVFEKARNALNKLGKGAKNQ